MSDRDGLYRKWEREGEPPLVGPMTDREKGFHVVQGVFGPVFVPDGIVSGDERDSAMTDRQTVTVGERTVTIIDGLVFVDMGEQGWMPPIYAQSTSPGHVTSVTEIVRTLLAMQTERDAERERAGQVWTVADELLKLLEGGEPGHPGEYARRTGRGSSNRPLIWLGGIHRFCPYGYRNDS